MTNKADMMQNLKYQWNLVKARMRGLFVGMAVGYVISFFFQNELITVFCGFFKYIIHFYDILTCFGSNASDIGFTAWFCMIIGGVIGTYVEEVLIVIGKIKPWHPRWVKVDEKSKADET